MSRIGDFYKNLIDIYGHEITDSLIEKQNNVLSFKQDRLGRTKFLIEYYLCLGKKKFNQIDSCDLCKQIFGIDFKDRPFEFSNWRGVLDFNKKNIKDIMIIGEAAGPGIKTHLNFSYGLCNLPIESNGIMDWNKINSEFTKIEKEILLSKLYKKSEVHKIISKLRSKKAVKHKLWQYLYEIFSESETDLEMLLNSLFITDMVRCNLGKTPKWQSNTIWEECINNCKQYFIEEVKLINPKLILITADSTYNTFTKFLKDENIEISLSDEIDFDKYLKSFLGRHFGKFTLYGNTIYFYHIYHNKRYDRLEKHEERPLYKRENQLFYSKELKQKILHW